MLDTKIVLFVDNSLFFRIFKYINEIMILAYLAIIIILIL